MRKVFTFFPAAIAALVLSASTVPLQAQDSFRPGPVEGVEVILTHSHSGIKTGVKTDISGTFTFQNVQPGPYLIRFQKTAFGPGPSPSPTPAPAPEPTAESTYEPSSTNDMTTTSTAKKGSTTTTTSAEPAPQPAPAPTYPTDPNQGETTGQGYRINVRDGVMPHTQIDVKIRPESLTAGVEYKIEAIGGPMRGTVIGE